MRLRLAVLLAGLGATAALAQTPPAASPPQPAPTATPSPSPSSDRDRMRDKIRDRLPPEIRDRFDAAREKALQDPKLQELRKAAADANKAFFFAMRDKMVEIDPGLAPYAKQPPGDGDRRGGSFGGDDHGFGSLTEQERDRLKNARAAAKDDPAVQAAEKKRDSATTPEERRAATDEYRKAIGAAILKADPTLGPVLDKLKPGPASKPPGAPGDMQMAAPTPPPATK